MTKNEYYIKDIDLADQGKKMIEMTMMDMPGILELEKLCLNEQPLKGLDITGCVIVTYETAAFILLLKKLGANLRWCSDNKYASLDDACAYIASQGIPIFATSDLTDEKYYWCFEQAAKFPTENGSFKWPDFIIDDGCDITRFLHTNYPDAYNYIQGTLEQTTCGVNAHYNLKNENKLLTKVMNVNESVTKSKFDNIYGSRESLIEGIQSTMNVQIGGKRVIVYGYGEVGKGCAKVLRGLGAKVLIVEIDPITAIQATMEGFEVVSKEDAVKLGDIFVTATGCVKTIAEDDIVNLRNNSILMNMGHGNMEIDTDFLLRSGKFKVEKVNSSVSKVELTTSKHVFVLADGYLVNLVGGNGHPPRVMSITYTNHVLALIELSKNPNKYKRGEIYRLPRQLDEMAARLNFPDVSKKLTTLTKEQAEYIGVNIEGPFKREDYRY